MDFISSAGYTTFGFLVVLTVLVFVHEMGHFLIARRNKVKVEVFSIGFGPELFGFNDRYGTRWKFSAVPLGGYVKMFGEGDMVTGVDDAEDRPMTEEERAGSFHHKSLGQRAAIVFAGPLANFIFAIIVMWGVFMFVGEPTRMHAAVGAIQPGSAAEQADFRPGDTVISISGEDIRWFDDLKRIVSANPGAELNFIVKRGGEEMVLLATPKLREVSRAQFEERYDEIEGDTETVKIGLIGITPDPNQAEYERHDPFTALMMGVDRTASMVMRILANVGEMISGERDADELGGPLAIAQISGEVVQTGLLNILFLMATLSINLGLINLFPVPMLDGGHLVFYIYEAIRGKPLSAKAQEYGFRMGLFLVLLLMVFATWNDISRLL